jgi:hypothetical protein
MAKVSKTIEDAPVKKVSNGFTPCNVIFDYVDKPTDYIFSKCFNVFDDKWRVNLYSKRYVKGIEGKYISNSYFVKFNTDNNKISIVSP